MDGDGDDIRYRRGAEDEPPTGELREEGPTGRGSFDPSPYFRQLRGRGGAQDYLDVKFRLLWLRREHADAEIVTEHIRIDDTIAIFKATVSIPGGGKATGHGSETTGDFPDYIEKAETKALGRALNALGYGAQFADTEQDAADIPVPSPVRETPIRPPAPVSTAVAPVAPIPAPLPPIPESPAVSAPPPAPPVSAAPAAPTPMTGRAADRRTPAARPTPVEIGTTRERQTPATPTPFPNQPTSRAAATAESSADEPPLEDYSWTAFWRWAREQGYDSKGGIEAFIGRAMNNLNPIEVRQLILAKRGET